MCKYCLDIENCTNKYFDVFPAYGKAFIKEEDNTFYIDFEIDNVLHCAVFKIYYCPICGRKL